MPPEIDPVAQQTGFGLAAYIILTTLLDKLADKGVSSRDELKELLEHAQLNAEIGQAIAPSPDMVKVARLAIETLIFASETKHHRHQNQAPPTDGQT